MATEERPSDAVDGLPQDFKAPQEAGAGEGEVLEDFDWQTARDDALASLPHPSRMLRHATLVAIYSSMGDGMSAAAREELLAEISRIESDMSPRMAGANWQVFTLRRGD